MPYSKRNQKCKNASGESGTFVTIKKDGGKRTCWKNKAAFEKATAARHAKGVKQEMKMTEPILKQFIPESAGEQPKEVEPEGFYAKEGQPLPPEMIGDEKKLELAIQYEKKCGAWARELAKNGRPEYFNLMTDRAKQRKTISGPPYGFPPQVRKACAQNNVASVTPDVMDQLTMQRVRIHRDKANLPPPQWDYNKLAYVRWRMWREKNNFAPHPDDQQKQEMKMTESKLRQIIIEELARIDNEEELRNLYIEAFQSAGVEANLLEQRDWFPIVTTGIAIGALGALMTLTSAHSDKKAAASDARAERSKQVRGSIETKTAEMEAQLTNLNAWSWTDDENPNSREVYPMIEFDAEPGGPLENKKFTVMPPEYAVFLQVKKDKDAGIARYGTPDSMEDIKDLRVDIRTAARNLDTSGQREQNRIDFVTNFDSPHLYDTLKSEVGIYGIGGQIYTTDDGTVKQAQAILPDFDKLESSYVGPLPLTGLSIEDTYNSFMFGAYLSNDEIEEIEIEIIDGENINPELIAKTRQHSANIEKQ